ncbi:MAG: non-canonical purine NTP pyrophosphatase [Planctomycetaceae bacterium]|nr:non-canonical purine NTP pyrophosphatase [Planctomycetaceae bacterium]
MGDARPILVLGTFNRKKGLELAQLFGPLGLTLVTLADCENPLEVVEDGETFTANAALKATLQAKHLGAWVLGEDSGLQVNALKGAPGVYSARFSGPGATDSSNNKLLLEKLDGVGLDKRTAGYACHMTLSDPGGMIRAESEGHCRGRIALQPRGTHGFGYDPLFEVLEYHRTFGELGPTAKAILSHRARAARRLIPALIELLDSDVLTLSPPKK